MVKPEIGPMLASLGQHVADLLGKVPDEALLYAEAGDAWQEAAIFTDLGDKILYRDPDFELLDAIGDVWEAEDEDKRWSVMLYKIENGRFDAEFMFPDQLDPEEGSFERRRRALAERYGEKAVDYSDP